MTPNERILTRLIRYSLSDAENIEPQVKITDDEIGAIARAILSDSIAIEPCRTILSWEDLNHAICWTRTKACGDPVVGKGLDKRVKLGTWVRLETDSKGASTVLVGIEVKKNPNKEPISNEQKLEDNRVFALRERMQAIPSLARFVVHVVAHFQTDKKIQTIVELGLKDLNYLAREEWPLAHVSDCAAQMLTIVGRLHEEGFVHGDVKPSNFLLMRDAKTIQLTDFDFTREIGCESPSFLGTLHYLAPEIYSAVAAQQTSVTQTVQLDAWSLGCSLFEIFTKQKLLIALVHPNQFKAASEIKALILSPDFQQKIDTLLKRDDLGIPLEYQRIIRSFLRVDPEERATVQTISSLAALIRSSLSPNEGKAPPVTITDAELYALASQILFMQGSKDAQIIESKTGPRSILSFANGEQVICWTRTKKGDPILGTGADKRVKCGTWVAHNQAKLVGIEVIKNHDKTPLSDGQLSRYANIFDLRKKIDQDPDLAPFIVRSHVHYPTDNKIKMIVELGLENLNYLREKEFPFEHVSHCAQQMLAIVAKLHEKGFIHTDVKLSNFLLMRDEETVKITDFDFMRKIGHMGSSKGSPAYMAPEVHSAHAGKRLIEHTVKLDAWSLGCSLFEIFTQERFFATLVDLPEFTVDDLEKLALSADFQEQIDLLLMRKENFIPCVYRPIIHSLLRVKPEERATVTEAYANLYTETI